MIRVTASPGNKIYGAMTLLVLYHAHSTILFEVPAKSFRPRPKVNSVVLEMDFERPYPMRVSSEEVFNRVVKAAFAHRRKTLLNSFRIHSPEWSDEILLKAMQECGVDSQRRAETLHMDEFLCLSKALPSMNS